MIFNRIIENFFSKVKEITAAWAGDSFLKFNGRSYVGLFFIISCIVSAVFIVWQPIYFLLLLAGILFLTAVFWQTEESLIILIFYLPFQIALNVSSNVDLASGRLFILVLFLAWFAKSLAKKNIAVPYTPVTWLLVIFLALAVLSAYFSIDQERSAVRLLFFLGIFPLYFITAALLNSTKKTVKAVYALLISAGIAGAAGIVQFLSQFFLGIDAIMDFWAKNIAFLFYGESFGKVIVTNPSWLVNVGGETFFRAISFFPDPHMFAFYLGLVAPIALCLALFPGVFNLSSGQKFLLYVCNCIVFLALGLTFSRAGYVGAFFGVAAVILLGWSFFTRQIRFAVITAVLLGGIIIFNAASNAGGLIISRFFSSFNPAEGSNSERLLNWRQAVKIIEKYPVGGAGVGAYAEAINARAPKRSSVTAHNTYLDIAAEMGIPALAVWVIILMLTIKNLLSVLRQGGRELSKEKVISLGLLGTFVWFSVQMVFDTAIYSPTLLAILMVHFGIAVNLRKEIAK